MVPTAASAGLNNLGNTCYMNSTLQVIPYSFLCRFSSNLPSSSVFQFVCSYSECFLLCSVCARCPSSRRPLSGPLCRFASLYPAVYVILQGLCVRFLQPVVPPVPPTSLLCMICRYAGSGRPEDSQAGFAMALGGSPSHFHFVIRHFLCSPNIFVGARLLGAGDLLFPFNRWISIIIHFFWREVQFRLIVPVASLVYVSAQASCSIRWTPPCSQSRRPSSFRSAYLAVLCVCVYVCVCLPLLYACACMCLFRCLSSSVVGACACASLVACPFTFTFTLTPHLAPWSDDAFAVPAIRRGQPRDRTPLATRRRRVLVAGLLSLALVVARDP